jgi:hypothetical protein
VRRLEAEMDSRALEIDAFEVSETGREPDRRISAAVVGGRDLVEERLALKLPAIEARLAAASHRLEQLTQLGAQGVVSESEISEARAEFQRLENESKLVHREQELRARYLRRQLTADRVELLAMREEAQSRVTDAQRELELAAARAHQIEALAGARAVSNHDAKEALHELTTREAQLRLARLELETIEARL